MWRLWQNSPEFQTVLESSKKERPKKRMREDGLRKKSKTSRKGKGDRRSLRNSRTRAESRTCHSLSAVGSTGVPVARVKITTSNAGLKSEHWKCGCRPERIDQYRSCYHHGEDLDSGPIQGGKQWKCVDPCKSHHYESWKNPGNQSFDGVEVSWRENRVVVRFAVLLVGAGMAPFVSRNRRENSCQRIETWVFLI